MVSEVTSSLSCCDVVSNGIGGGGGSAGLRIGAGSSHAPGDGGEGGMATLSGGIGRPWGVKCAWSSPGEGVWTGSGTHGEGRGTCAC